MERYNVVAPEEKILSKRNFIVDQIIPLAIRIVENGDGLANRFVILFLAGQNSTEENILLQIMFSMDRRDETFIKSQPLYMDNLLGNKSKLQLYVDATKDATNDSLFMTDFKMTRSDKSFYFLGSASQKQGEVINALDLYFTKENFVKLNVFFKRMSIYDRSAEFVFLDKKFKDIEFSTIEEVKLNASTTDLISRIVCSHYTCRNGKQLYKFKYISPKLDDRKSLKSIDVEKFNSLYSEAFVISDMIYCDDNLYVIYEERSDITNEYKKTLALIFTKEMYDQTNLVDYSRIYKEENKDG